MWIRVDRIITRECRMADWHWVTRGRETYNNLRCSKKPDEREEGMRTNGRGCRGAESHACKTLSLLYTYRTFHAPMILTHGRTAGVPQSLVVSRETTTLSGTYCEWKVEKWSFEKNIYLTIFRKYIILNIIYMNVYKIYAKKDLISD